MRSPQPRPPGRSEILRGHHRWPFGKIDGPGTWNKPHLNQGPLFFKLTKQKGHPRRSPIEGHQPLTLNSYKSREPQSNMEHVRIGNHNDPRNMELWDSSVHPRLLIPWMPWKIEALDTPMVMSFLLLDETIHNGGGYN